MRHFNEWFRLGKVPGYVKASRIVPLSKESNNPYPELGNVRTISIAPAIGKLFELCILQFIQREIEEKSLLNENQIGFK